MLQKRSESGCADTRRRRRSRSSTSDRTRSVSSSMKCLSRSPRPIFNEKSLCALGKGVATTGELAEGRRRKGARGPAPFPGLERDHGRRRVACSGNRRRPRCLEWRRISRCRGGGDRGAGHAFVGRPRGGAFGLWGHLRDHETGRRRRRSRRRLARTDRRQGRACGQGHEPAARRPHLDGRLGALAARRGQNRPRGAGGIGHREAA